MSFDRMRNSVVESWVQRIERWLIPTIAHNQLGRDTGPFADASMTTLWHRVRRVGAMSAIVIGVVFVFVVGWIQGLVLVAAGLAVLFDVRFRLAGEKTSLFPSFLLEGLLIALCGPILHMSYVAYLLAFAYLATAALYFMPVRRAIVIHEALAIMFALSVAAVEWFDIPRGSELQRTIATSVGALVWTAFLLGLAWVATRTVASFHHRDAVANHLQAAVAVCAEALQGELNGATITEALVPVSEAMNVDWVSVEKWPDHEGGGLVDAGFGPIPGERRREIWEANPALVQRLKAGFPTVSEGDGFTELVVPAVCSDGLAAVIVFGCARRREWKEPDSRTGGRVGSLIASAIERDQARRRLVDLVMAKDEFVASVSHELRTPLTAVVGLAQELRDGLVVFDHEEQTELVSLIADQGAEVAAIVDDLLVAARIDAGTVTIVPSLINVRQTVSAALSAGVAMGGPKTVELAGDGVAAWADGHRVRQIIRNLLTNAARYGGPDVRIECGGADGMAWVKVSDNGDPIPDEDRDRIFESYESAHKPGGQPGSVGLGLSVSRQLASLMGGDLSYEYRNGESIFTLTLPTDPAYS
ncbi:MAG: sensor histidine kinase [Acidimicrobiia bacterium]